MRPLLEAMEPLRDELGPIFLVGWDWGARADWAIELGLEGSDVDPDLLARLGVETQDAIPFDQVVEFVSRARFSPIVHRPLFNQLGLVTNRTFETFCADTIPLLMLPGTFIEQIYGPHARALAPDDDVAGCLADMMRRPDVYWGAVLKTRAQLAERHSFEQRFHELLAILES